MYVPRLFDDFKYSASYLSLFLFYFYFPFPFFLFPFSFLYSPVAISSLHCSPFHSLCRLPSSFSLFYSLMLSFSLFLLFSPFCILLYRDKTVFKLLSRCLTAKDSVIEACDHRQEKPFTILRLLILSLLSLHSLLSLSLSLSLFLSVSLSVSLSLSFFLSLSLSLFLPF